jgi:hypothetical protein
MTLERTGIHILLKKIISAKISVGCARWGLTRWIGKIPPEGTK